MDNNENRRDELIDSITRKMKFLGTYDRYFNEIVTADKTIKELEDFEIVLDFTVNYRSKPINELILKDKLEGRLDVRWEPFLQALKSIARDKKTFWRRLIMSSLINHLKNSDILGNYILTLLKISYSNIKNGKPNIATFQRRVDSFFKAAKMESFHDRFPMAFTHEEGYAIKAITQYCRDDKISLKKVSKIEFEFLQMMIEGEAADTPIYYISPPWFVKKIFGSKENYEILSLRRYGERFIEIYHEEDFPIY